jgi:hypothetical protein
MARAHRLWSNLRNPPRWVAEGLGVSRVELGEGCTGLNVMPD